jgi:hypothetical protein
MLNIADFTNVPREDFVAAVFSEAERCNVPTRGPDDYNFSCVVAELVRERFAGMRVPGVKGELGQRYSNIVMFKPYPDWPNWLEPETDPYRLDEPVP